METDEKEKNKRLEEAIGKIVTMAIFPNDYMMGREERMLYIGKIKDEFQRSDNHYFIRSIEEFVTGEKHLKGLSLPLSEIYLRKSHGFQTYNEPYLGAVGDTGKEITRRFEKWKKENKIK